MKLIVAVDNNFGIGKNKDLLTHLPDDLKQFKEKTQGNILIMGRKTIDSLKNGKLLPGRETWILSRNPEYKKEGAKIFSSVQEIIQYMKRNEIPQDKVYVCGGKAIYHECLPYVDIAYVTKLEKDFHPDVIMDDLDVYPGLQLVHISEKQEYKGLIYRYCRYERIK